MEEPIQAEELACEDTTPEETPETTLESIPETEPEEQPDEEMEEEPEEEPEQPHKPAPLEKTLATIALVMALVTGVLTAVCWPYFGQEQNEDPESLVRPMETIHIKLPEITEPTEPLPQPEKNPYGRLDFQYEGRYLGCIKADTIPGVDVSYYQGQIDWEKVKASGIEFAIIRLGYRGYGKEGKLVEDKMYWQNIQNAITAGLDVGVYFFSQALNAEEAVEEANFVLDRIRDYDISFPVVFDWETISSDTARTNDIETEQLCQAANVFCHTVRDAGYIPMVYSNQSVSLLNYDLSRLQEWDFWYAEYKEYPTFYYDFDIWQYGSSGIFKGVPDAYVDTNISFIDYSKIKP